MSKLAIVILNYNGQPFLARFLPSVFASTYGLRTGEYSEDEVSLVVADNGSTDGSVDYLRTHFPTVRVLELGVNDGYAGGYNRALQQVSAEYYVLLNSDVEVTPGWIEPVLSLMKANPQIAACQPKIRSYVQRGHFEHAGAAGGYLDWMGYAFCRGRIFDAIEPDLGQYDDDRPVFWATGACMFVRAAIFHQAGGFDAGFFAHMEEIDWCWRVHRLGYEVWTCGQSVVYHVGGGTLHKSNPRKTFYNYRNSLMMLYKNLPKGKLVSMLFLRLVMDGVSAIKFIEAGQWQDIQAILRAHGAFYGQIRQLHRQRRTLQNQDRSAVQIPIYSRSIVWAYYAEYRKRFSQLKETLINPRQWDEHDAEDAYSSPAKTP